LSMFLKVCSNIMVELPRQRFSQQLAHTPVTGRGSA
jgi:hypothetical protein